MLHMPCELDRINCPLLQENFLLKARPLRANGARTFNNNTIAGLYLQPFVHEIIPYQLVSKLSETGSITSVAKCLVV